jgi:NarL family two-component system response regulator LiaR
MAITILLADDHKIVREGTRQLLEQSTDFQIVGEAADGAEAVRLAGELHPDLVIMDVRLPVLSGMEATRLITTRYPHVRVLVLSAYDGDSYVFPLLEAGASGYLLKTASGAELADAIRAIHSHGTVLSPRILAKVVGHLAGRQEFRSAAASERLTDREMVVLRATATGRSNKEIAQALSISPQTVQVHLRNIFGKLSVNSRSAAIAYAITHGWITLEAVDE